VEMLVVTVGVGLMAVSVVGVFLNMSRVNRKVQRMQEVESTASWILRSMEQVIQSAREIENADTVCFGERRANLTVVGRDGGVTNYSCSNGQIASGSAALNNINRVSLTSCNFVSCEGGSGAQATVVTLNFELVAGDASSPRIEDQARKSFYQRIVLRGY